MKSGRIKRQHGRVGGLDAILNRIIADCPHVTRIVPGRIKVRRTLRASAGGGKFPRRGRNCLSRPGIVLPMSCGGDVTSILDAAAPGDPHTAAALLPLVYTELRRLAARRLAQERTGQTLEPTALVHEAYVRLVGQANVQRFSGRGHFFAAAAEAMRRILVENARRKLTAKAGGGRLRVELGGAQPAAPAAPDGLDLLALDEALKKLEQAEPRRAELVKLRFFAGLTNDQAAHVLGVSSATAENDWAYARAWLRLEVGAP